MRPFFIKRKNLFKNYAFCKLPKVVNKKTVILTPSLILLTSF
jgi:hypothetical protein